MTTSHPKSLDRLLRFALRLDAVLSLILGGVFLLGAASIAVEDNRIAALRILGVVFVGLSLLAWSVSQQQSISVPHVLYLTMPKVLTMFVLAADAVTGFLLRSPNAQPLEFGVACVLTLIVVLEQFGVYRWKKAGIAIFGYDPVAFFMDKQAVVGNALSNFVWNGQIWQFSSEEHRQAFMQTPDKYTPAVNGECSFGHAFGLTFDANPRNWDIVNGQLHFNSAGWTRFIWKLFPSTRRALQIK